MFVLGTEAPEVCKTGKRGLGNYSKLIIDTEKWWNIKEKNMLMDNPNLKNSCGWVCEQVCESECMCVDIYIELDGYASFCEQAIHFFPHWLYHHFCDETQLSCFFKYLSYGDMVEYHIKVKRVGGD